MRHDTTSTPRAAVHTATARSARIDALERELRSLYLQRAGQMEPGQDWGWCACCGQTSVVPATGEDSCHACLAELTADRSGLRR